jgi:predicted DNA-binding protein with PD1-like motif
MPKMGSKELQAGRNFVVRARHGADIIMYLTGFGKENNVSATAFTALGALKNAKLGFYE